MKCFAFREGGPGTSGNVCDETGMSGRAMRPACPIANSTDAQCNVVGRLPLVFLNRRKEIARERMESERNQLG